MKKEWKRFTEAKEFVHSLNLTGQKQWKQYCASGNKPDDIPSHPDSKYKNKGWIDWGNWLGTGNVAHKDKKFSSFEDARMFVRKLKLQSRASWREYRKSGNKPNNIPTNPEIIYKDKGWINISDWLGTGTISPRDRVFLSFEDAKKITHSLNLKSQTEWFEYCKSSKKHEDMPVKPQNTYKKQWTSWGDWLGTGRVADQNKEFRSFEDAREFAKILKLKNREEWVKYCKSGKKPNDIPLAVWITYKKQWMGMGDFLGTGTIATQDRVYRQFNEAKKFIQSLGIKNNDEWIKYCKSGKKPDDIPAAPWVVYSKNKEKK